MTLTIYHNPRCSKSRKTLNLLQDSGIGPRVVEYLDNPPTAERILQLAAMLGVPVAELLRRGEDAFRNGSDLPSLDNDTGLAVWIERNPKTLQRPIVVDDEDGRAVIGRPPENVLGLLEK